MTAVPGICLGAALYGLLSQTDLHVGAMVFAAGTVLSGPVAWAIVLWKKPHLRSLRAPLRPAAEVVAVTTEPEQ
jgi:hypothetical protein